MRGQCASNTQSVLTTFSDKDIVIIVKFHIGKSLKNIAVGDELEVYSPVASWEIQLDKSHAFCGLA